jgi:hypothetical protein
MAKYVASPGSLSQGVTIIGTVDGLGAYKDTGYRILADSGVQNLKPDEWYPMQALCDFFAAVSSKVGKSTFFLIGKNLVAKAPLPPEIDSIEKVYAGFDQVYKTNFRNVPESEGWNFELTGPTSARMICTSPFPDEYTRGITEGFGRRFKNNVTAKIDETKPRVDSGGKSVTILVSW